jgi:GT2 family glycosyltransferase
MDLSVIIVSFNTRRLLDDCLRSVFAAEAPPGGVEVIVVDNGSVDGSIDMVSRKYSQVKLVISPDNRGFSAANNLGSSIASGEFLLFLNSDTILSPRALSQPLEFMRANDDVGALTVQLVYPTGERDPDNHRGFPTPWNAFCHFSGLSRLLRNQPRFNGYFRSYEDFGQVHQVPVIAGSYMLMPRALDRLLGGWDETYFFYGEDIDYCYRINEAGYRIMYYPMVEVIHYKGASSGLRKESAEIARPPRETRIKVAEESVRAMEIFYQKFYRDKYPRLLTALVLAGIRFRGWLRVLKHRLT